MVFDGIVRRVFLLPGASNNLLHQTVPGGLKNLPRYYMQKETSKFCTEPKRTARKGVKAGDKTRIKIVKEHDACRDDENVGEVWQKFCKSNVPLLVREQMRTVKELELELGEELTFGGPRGSLKGRPGAVEDHRHRAFYSTLSDPEQKLQNFAARQVACRVLGSKGYACENCWLPMQDCMCGILERGSLWQGVCLWLYTHPKDFLRKNNTGKLLWQVFGDTAARLTICGIQEQEEAMWEIFKQAGRGLVWCVYPERTPPDYKVSDIPVADLLKSKDASGSTIHFVFIDGTWCNSKSMVSRLKERATAIWGESSMPCVALSPTSVSVMHELRPQPSAERTCTAAAAGQLLEELSMRSELAGRELERSAEIVHSALDVLQNALVTRRSRVGRPSSRVVRASCESPVAIAI